MELHLSQVLQYGSIVLLDHELMQYENIVRCYRHVGRIVQVLTLYAVPFYW